jgi:hypothetical protein
MYDITYSFITSQPLTKQQIDYINQCLTNLPTTDTEDFLDVPEYVSVIENPFTKQEPISKELQEIIDSIR